VITNNTLSNNGSNGNLSNGDLANQPAASNPRNCFSGNHFSGMTDPPNIETVDGPPCNTPGSGDSAVLTSQLVCASGLAPTTCPATGKEYPQPIDPKILAIPAQATMPNPCEGVPDNAWCQGGRATTSVPSGASLYPITGGAKNTLATANACAAPRLRFRIRQPKHDRIASLKVYVNRKLVLRRRHGGAGTITIKRPKGSFTVKIVTKSKRGHTKTSVRRYRGCTKTKPTTHTQR
jgi:hypothetical protein